MAGGMSIKGDVISLMRGDTAILVPNFTKSDESYTLRDDETAYFTVKKSVHSDEILFQLTLTEDGKFVFQHSTTKDLKAGNYKYDVQVMLSDGQVYTAMGPADFKLLPDITTDK